MNEQIINEQNLVRTGRYISSAGHPTRIEIVKLLVKQKSMNVSELEGKLKLSQPVVSHHLNILKNSGVLKSNRNGKNVEYSLNGNVIEKLEKTVQIWSKS